MPKLFCILAMLLLRLTTTAQEAAIFTNYNAKHGLPQSSIYGITQDANGFIWVGTAGGLSRFDGYRFTTYKMSAQDSTAITGYKEFRFYNDSSGRLWIVHFNGISIYNAKKDNFINLFVYNPQNVVIAENHFYGEDKDFIWVGLCSYGIVKVNKHTLKVHNTSLTRSSHRANNMTQYQGFLENNKLWILDRNESENNIFSIYDIAKQKADTIAIPLVNIANLNDSEIVGIDTKSVFIIKKRTLSYRSFPVHSNGREHNVVNIYRKSPTEVILSSALQGLFFIDTRKATVKHIAVTNPANPQSFLYARGVFEDRSGNMWIGTRGDGVEKMRYPFKKFRSYQLENARNNVFGVYADSEHIYAGIQSQGLSRFPRTGGQILNVSLNKKFPGVLNNAFIIKEYGKDKLIVVATSSENNGNNLPFIYTKATGKLELMNAEVLKVFKQYWGRGNMRHFMYREPTGNYITNIGENVLALRPCRNDKLCPILLAHFPGEALTSGFTSSDGTRWIGSFSGVFRLTTDGWQRVQLPKNKEVKTISEDPDGNIWMGTNDEIYVVNKALKTIQHFTEDKELINGHIYTIIRDNDGNMWFSHNKGLSVYYWKEKRFEHFDEGDGLNSPEYNISASYKKEDGELLFGGVNGVTAFYPHEILHNANAPAVKITGIRVFDELYKTDSAYWNIRNIRLPYTENSLSFEFTLPEYTNELKNTYQFNMIGVDNRWINAGDRHFTRYAGLQPGHYQFKIRGANNDGVYGPETIINIEIVPPFWKRTWFIVLAILLFVVIILSTGIFIQKIRQRKAIRALELQHKIQLERERISRDLHDNVGTQLSLISKNLEGIIEPKISVSDDDRMHNLRNISQTSKEVIFTLRETIWALNREEISVEELSDKLKSFAQKLFNMNRDCRLLFKEDLENDNVVLSPSEAIHLFRICQEAITNSLKYAKATLLEIDISTTVGKYRIVIGDNGVGFDTAVKKNTTSYGLDNMKYRAAEIQCDCIIDTAPGKGTIISINKK